MNGTTEYTEITEGQLNNVAGRELLRLGRWETSFQRPALSTFSVLPVYSVVPFTPLMPDKTIITLLTDFGTADYFVAAMKGVILSAQPDAVIVDISHEIPAHDITTAPGKVLWR